MVGGLLADAGTGLVPPDEVARKASLLDALAWKVTEPAVRLGQHVGAHGRLATRRGQRELRWPRLADWLVGLFAGSRNTSVTAMEGIDVW